jgi:hypothetical protein
MITKQQLCRHVINEARFKYGIPEGQVFRLADFMISSSTLAVALEFMGHLTKEQEEYSRQRGGTVYNFYDRDLTLACHLSFRELLDLLPSED